MKIFNIDQHISVVADLKHIWRHLGHEIDDVCLSGHAFVMGRQGETVPMLDGENWCALLNEDRWDDFYDAYKDELESADAFLCCYPPIFARLYQKWNKPIIVHIPIRFDYGIHNRPEHLEWFVEYLKDERITLTANSVFDKKYAESFIGRGVKHIPSLCEYTGMRYSPRKSEGLYYGPVGVPGLDTGHWKRREQALPGGYQWYQVAEFEAIAHFPYQVSTMSLFEQYTANIPLFLPTMRLMMELYDQHLVLEHYSPFKLAGGNHGVGSKISGNFENGYDPNDYENRDAVAAWLEYADYYDSDWMPHINYFDSIEELNDSAHTMDLQRASTDMELWNIQRRHKVYQMWKEVLDGVEKRVA